MSLRGLSAFIGAAGILLSLIGSGVGQQAQPVARPHLQQIDRSIAKGTTVVHPDRVEIKLDSAHVDVSRTELLVRGPQGWIPAPDAVRPLPGGSARIQMERGKWYLLQSEEHAPDSPPLLTTRPVLLPGRLIYTPSAGEPGGAEGESYSWATFLALAESPLPWNNDLDAYSGEVITGLVELYEEGEEAPPGMPQSLQLRPPVSVVLTAISARVSPSQCEIGATGTSGFKSVRVTSDGAADSCSITARSDLGEGTVVFTVARCLGRIRLIPGRTKILGYGFGKTSIAVVREARDGTPLMGPGALLINCNAAKGHLTPTTAEITDGESQTSIELDSDGTGEVEIIASAGAVSGTATVEFVSPVLFVIATLLAGVLGGYVRGWKEGKKAEASKRKLLERMGIGAVVSFGAMAVVAVGLVNLLPLDPPPTVAVAIAVGMLSGYFGAPLFDLIISLIGWKK